MFLDNNMVVLFDIDYNLVVMMLHMSMQHMTYMNNIMYCNEMDQLMEELLKEN
jgi:hypothetical protein